ncbi:hypothetical protein Angca_005812, partial [Angiostrongylus cantonensis]
FPYDSKFVKILLKDVHIMTIGDSIMRGIYKDLIAMLHGDELVKDIHLKTKTESSFFGDRQIDILPLENDRVFRQAREFQTDYYLIQYLFTTRQVISVVMKVDIERAFLEMCSTGEFPDVLLINSCLWDITRLANAIMWSSRLSKISFFINKVITLLPIDYLDTWIIGLPFLTDCALLQTSQVYLKAVFRMLVVDANFRASQLFRAAGYDVLDLAFYMRNQALYSYRSKDGIHWDSVGTRIMTQLVIGHLVRSWNI